MRLARLFVSLYAGLTAVVFGGTLLRPVDTFDVGTAWNAMAARAPEPVWGAAILVCGLLVCVAPALRFHWLLHLPVFAVWLYVALMFALGDHRSTGAPTAAIHALFAGALFMISVAEQLERWGDRYA